MALAATSVWIAVQDGSDCKLEITVATRISKPPCNPDAWCITCIKWALLVVITSQNTVLEGIVMRSNYVVPRVFTTAADIKYIAVLIDVLLAI